MKRFYCVTSGLDVLVQFWCNRYHVLIGSVVRTPGKEFLLYVNLSPPFWVGFRDMLIIQNIINLQASQEKFEAVITIIKVKERKTSYWKRKRKARLKKKKGRRNNLKVFPLVGKGEYIPSRFLKLFDFLFHTICTFIALSNVKGIDRGLQMMVYLQNVFLCELVRKSR